MKHRLIHTIAGGAAMLLLFGCQADEAVFDEGKQAVNIQPVLQAQTGATDTRTAVGVQGFSANDVIGISMAVGDAEIAAADANHSYTYAEGAWTTGSEKFLWSYGSPHTFYAYYPYSATYAESATFELPVEGTAIDFTKAGAWAAADKAWGMVTKDPTSKTITIPMTHRMAQVVIKLASDVKITSVELLAPQGNYSATGQFNVKDGTVSIASTQTGANPQTVKMLAGANNTFYAMVLPGHTFKADAPFARITDANNKQYIYNLALAESADLVTAIDKSVKFTLNLVKSAITGFGVTAEAWEAPMKLQPVGEEAQEDEWTKSLTKINVTEPGTLFALLTKAKEDGSDITKLHITGRVNAVDLFGVNNNGASCLGAFIKNKDNGVTDLYYDAVGVTEIPVGNYLKASSLVKVRLMNITKCGNWMLMQCASLKEVFCPSLETIGNASFNGCPLLETVILPAAKNMTPNLFAGTNNVKKLVVHSQGTVAGGGLPGSAGTLTLYLCGTSVDTQAELESKKTWNTTTFSKLRSNYKGTDIEADYIDDTKYDIQWNNAE